jgi:uncharacterized membrane protein
VGETRLLAVAYGDTATADRALDALLTLAGEHGLALEDAAVVVRSRDGGASSVEIRQAKGLAVGEGVVGGGTLGLLAGLAVSIPIAGALLGAVAGIGLSAVDRGIDDDELRRIGRTLDGGGAALLALVGDVDWSRLRDCLEPYGGALIASEVAADVEAGLASPDP